MQSPDAAWWVVCRPDGIIEGVSGGAPQHWRGMGVDDAFASKPELLDALARLFDALVPGTCVHAVRATTTHEGASVAVDLLLLEALPIRRAHVPLELLFVSTLDVFTAQARSADVELRLRLAPNLPTVAVVDPEKIAWAVATLVGGALRHVRPAERGARVLVDVAWDGAVDEIVVGGEDNGPGIPPARAKWLFDRDPATGRSAGLALLMVKDVAIAHRGSVGVDSSLERGTKFTLRFPRRV